MNQHTTANGCSYARLPVEVVSGQGSIVYDDAGKAYIDMGSGGGVMTFGVADPAWNAAVAEQLQTLQHTSCLYRNEPCSKLADVLCEKTGMYKAVFGNSGRSKRVCGGYRAAVCTKAVWGRVRDGGHAARRISRAFFDRRVLCHWNRQRV